MPSHPPETVSPVVPGRYPDTTLWLAFFKGVGIGLAIAIPVGPIGLLTIRRTIADGRLIGLATGLGAATADFLYGCVAAFGVTAAAHLLSAGRVWLGLGGGLFLCYLGVQTFLSKLATVAANVTGRGLAGAYASTLALTLTNPATIFAFAAIFAGVGIPAGRQSYLATSLLVTGVFLGSALWWLTLTYGVDRLRSHMTPLGLQWLNWGSGLMIGGFGVVAIALAVKLLASR